ncbi:unnamed protein product [marine sediment metagenome]|uniref:Uncharacterized protein n=1 Tax=marine sediment metagenome TaxID=412755 RepID=X1RQP6_9ZZZZ
MFAKYLCLGCGITWRRNKRIIICPVCRSKVIKAKEEVDTKEVIDRLTNKEGTYENKFYRELDY